MISLYHRNVSSNGGPDAVPLILCFYMMLCPSGAAYSLDARREAKRRGTPAEPLIVPWGVRLLQMQICLIYFQSCVIKCGGATWMDGTATHYVLFNREFDRFNLEWLGAYPMLVNLMTHGALLIEFVLAFWLWFRPTRRWAILGGILLHAGIRPVLNIPGLRRGDVRDLPDVPRPRRGREPAPRPRSARLAGPPGHPPAQPRVPAATDRPIGLPSWQQREFAFDGAEGYAGAEPWRRGETRSSLEDRSSALRCNRLPARADRGRGHRHGSAGESRIRQLKASGQLPDDSA